MLNIYKHIKSAIPNQWKYPLWYIFKAPQRLIGWYTLLTDLRGLLIYAFRAVFPATRLQQVSICTGLYNRSDNYIEQLVKSITMASSNELIELSVFDCGSSDTTNLEEKIRQHWSGKLVFRSEATPFARSYAFNKAVDQASSTIVFVCDADLWLPRNIVTLCNQFTGLKRAWYPIYFFLYRGKPAIVAEQNGEWEQYASRGMFACLKADFEKVGRLDERYKVWGEEDVELWGRFHQHHFTVIRNRQRGMYHHWHQTFNTKFMHMND